MVVLLNELMFLQLLEEMENEAQLAREKEELEKNLNDPR